MLKVAVVSYAIETLRSLECRQQTDSLSRLSTLRAALRAGLDCESSAAGIRARPEALRISQEIGHENR